MTSGCGRASCSATPVSGTTGRLNAIVSVLSADTSVAPCTGCVLATSRKPAVMNLKDRSPCSFRPDALAASALNVTRYSVLRARRSVGVNVSWFPRTLTSPGTCGSMLNALLVLAGSMVWSNVTTTGAAMNCYSPRSGLTLTTVGGKGGRVGVGSGVGASGATAVGAAAWAGAALPAEGTGAATVRLGAGVALPLHADKVTSTMIAAIDRRRFTVRVCMTTSA